MPRPTKSELPMPKVCVTMSVMDRDWLDEQVKLRGASGRSEIIRWVIQMAKENSGG